MPAQNSSKPMNLFVSYAHADGEVARQLGEALKAEGFNAWVDADILPGENFAAVIAKQLDKSDAMVVLLSPAWASSPEGRREVSYALGMPRFEGRLIPVVVEKTRDYPWVFDRGNFQMIQYTNSDTTSRKIAEVLRGSREKAAASAEHGKEKRRS
jgi:hypothetical protein